MSDNRKAHSIGSAFAWSFLEQGGAKAVNLIVQVALARILAPEVFGILAILLVVTEVADVVAQSGLGLALVQSDDDSDEAYTTAFWLSCGLAGVMYAIMFFIAPILSGFYGMPDLEVYLRVIGLVVIANAATSILRAFFQKQMNFRSLFVANTISMIAAGVIGISAALLGWGAWALIAQVLSLNTLMCIILFFKVSWKPSIYFNLDTAKALFSYGWKIGATGILNVVYTGVAELVIGKTSSAADLGLYSQGRKWPYSAVSIASNSIQNVLFPAFASLKNDMPSFSAAVKRALITGTFVIAPLTVLFATVAEPLIALLLTEKWLPCVPIFQMYCVSNVLLMAQLANLRAYMALGKSGLYLKLQIIKVILGTVAVCSVAVLTCDIYLVAATACLFFCISIIAVDMNPAKRVIGYGRISQLRDIAPCIALSAAAGLASLGIACIGLPYALSLAAQIVVFLAVYILASVFLRLDGLEDCKHLVKGIFGRHSKAENDG